MDLPNPKTSLYQLQQEHVKNARVFANRQLQILGLDMLKNGKTIAEVGVAYGDFSEYMIKNLKPKEFVAFDLFEIHTWPGGIWNQKPSEVFGEKTHLQFYQDRFAGVDFVKTAVGRSTDTMPTYPDEYFDMIYIDADHTYEAVRAESLLADKKIKKDGIIIFNDYIIFDYTSGVHYGVVQAVNQFVIENGYEVIGLAIQHDMFCDVAIRRVSSK